jgi:hypothetical protein
MLSWSKTGMRMHALQVPRKQISRWTAASVHDISAALQDCPRRRLKCGHPGHQLATRLPLALECRGR